MGQLPQRSKVVMVQPEIRDLAAFTSWITTPRAVIPGPSGDSEVLDLMGRAGGEARGDLVTLADLSLDLEGL